MDFSDENSLFSGQGMSPDSNNHQLKADSDIENDDKELDGDNNYDSDQDVKIDRTENDNINDNDSSDDNEDKNNIIGDKNINENNNGDVSDNNSILSGSFDENINPLYDNEESDSDNEFDIKDEKIVSDNINTEDNSYENDDIKIKQNESYDDDLNENGEKEEMNNSDEEIKEVYDSDINEDNEFKDEDNEVKDDEIKDNDDEVKDDDDEIKDNDDEVKDDDDEIKDDDDEIKDDDDDKIKNSFVNDVNDDNEFKDESEDEENNIFNKNNSKSDNDSENEENKLNEKTKETNGMKDESSDEELVSRNKKRTLPIDSDDEEINFQKGKRLKKIDSEDEEEEEDKDGGDSDIDKNDREENSKLFGSDDDDDIKDNDEDGDGDGDKGKVNKEDDDIDKERKLFGSDVDEDEEETNKTNTQGRNDKGGDDSSDDDDDADVKKKKMESDDNDAVDMQDEKIVHEIFGMSDEEDNFEGFNEEDNKIKRNKKGRKIVPSREMVSDDEGSGRDQPGFVSDFLQMMETKKASKKRRSHKGEGEFVNDSDDVVDEMLNKMKESLQKDIQSVKEKKPAFQVLKLLPYVKTMLLRVELHQAMIDLGILTHITEWLAPFPDNSLPNLEVRETLLKHLIDFTSISTEGLKMSGLGKAVMFLFKHPKENRNNKEICHTLINRWAKPIFSQGNDMRLTREEREQRDKELIRSNSLTENTKPEVLLRPGDPGFVQRARVPQPSNMDYVNRPRWNVEERSSDGPSKKKMNKLQKYSRVFKSGKKT